MCVFPVIDKAIKNGTVSINIIAKTLEKSEKYIENRLSGKAEFNIDEAITINMVLFPDIPFKTLFKENLSN